MNIPADLRYTKTHEWIKEENGVVTVGLGPRILRCETAPLAVLSAVMTLTGNLE